MNFEGLFYLVSGISIFITLTLLLRSKGLSEKLSDTSSSANTNSNLEWISPEKLKIHNIIDETSDVKTFQFKRISKDKFPIFKPGQFMSFQINNQGKVFRSYSLSGSCENQNIMEVSIKKLPDGIGSGWFHSLKVGDTVTAHPPGGHFTNNDLAESSPRIFVAGGIGVTPFLSMIQTALQRGQKHQIHLFYGARTRDDLAFHKLLQLLEKRNHNFSYTPVLSEKTDHWHGETGFITFDLISAKASSLTSNSATNYYFCGPPILTESVSKSLMDNNIQKTNIHSEKFASPSTISEDDIEHIEAKIHYKGEVYNYSGKQNLLEFLEDQKVEMDFSCRSGVCGACKVKIKKGSVNALTDSGLIDDEKKSHILTCVCWPKEDLYLE